MARHDHNQLTMQNLIDLWFPTPTQANRSPEFVLAIDIGQGNLNAVFNDVDGQPFLYYDLGAGVMGSQFTKPEPFPYLCFQGTPRFVISHWDEDHIETANNMVALQNDLPNTDWLAPDQTKIRPKLSMKAKALRTSLANNGRNLHVWPDGRDIDLIDRPPFTFFKVNGHNTLRKQDANNSGLVLRLQNPDGGNQYMLLTGDAEFFDQSLDPGCDQECVGIITGHHGAPMKRESDIALIPRPEPQGMPETVRSVVYSFGWGNHYGHPGTTGVDAYDDRGWVDAYRLDTGGAEADATYAGPRGNVGLVWPNRARRPGKVAASASVRAMQEAVVALLATGVAEITHLVPGQAQTSQIAAAAVWQAALLCGAEHLTHVMRHDGSLGDVHKSTDEAMGWSAANKGLSLRQARALLVDGNNPGTIYAGTQGGVFKSTDLGGTWQASNQNLVHLDILSLTFESGQHDTVLAGTEGGHVYKSTNGGQNWDDLGLPGGRNAQAVAVNANKSDVIYVGTQGGGIFKSDNGGVAWNTVNTGLGHNDVRALVQVSGFVDTWYAGTAAGVFKTIDGGANWTAAHQPAGTDVRALGLDGTGTILYAGTTAGVFCSTNDGVWVARNTGLTDTNVLALADATGNVWYVGTPTGVFKTLDAGVTWALQSTGMSSKDVRSLAVDPNTPANVFAGTSVTDKVCVVATALGAIAGNFQTAVANVATYAMSASNADQGTLAADAAVAVLTCAASVARVVSQTAVAVRARMNARSIGSQAAEAGLDACDKIREATTRNNALAHVPGAIAIANSLANLAVLNAPNAVAVTDAVADAVTQAYGHALGVPNSGTRQVLDQNGVVVAPFRARTPPTVAKWTTAFLTGAGVRADLAVAVGTAAALAPGIPVNPEANVPVGPLTVNDWAQKVATVGSLAAGVGRAAGGTADTCSAAGAAAARVIVPAVYGAPQIGCHRHPTTCGVNLCSMSIHHFVANP